VLLIIFLYFFPLLHQRADGEALTRLLSPADLSVNS